MALSAFVDAFNIGLGAAASTVVRTGYGFQPKACVYFWSGQTATNQSNGIDAKPGIGFACSATDRRCLTTQHDDGAGTMAMDRKHNDAQCIECLTVTATVDGNADLQSFDANGQTLVIDDQFTTDIRVHCLALGGSDLTNAATFQFQAPLAGGNADFTGLAFQPSAILLASIGYATAPPAVTGHAVLSVGMATSSTAQGMATYYDTDASASSACGAAGNASECVALMNSATSLNFRAAFVSFLSNGFRLNWLEVDGSTQPYIFGLALRGGSYLVGDCTSATTLTTVTESGFGFQPRGLFAVSPGAVATAQDAVATAAARISLGAASGTTARGGHAFFSENGQNAATVAVWSADAQFFGRIASGTGVQEGLMDLQSFDSGGFTGVMVDVDIGTSFISYLAMGDGAAAPATKARPPSRPALRFYRGAR